MDFPESEAVMESEFPERVLVTVCGFGGRVPISKRWKSWRISARRQAQSALVVTRAPLVNVNGSGSLAFATRFVLTAGQPVGAGPAGVVVAGAVVGTEVGTEVGTVVGEVVGAVPRRHWEYQ